MKKLIKSAVLATAASTMMLANAASAADQKIGVVNFQEVMSKIPQTAAVMQSLKTEFKDQEAVVAQLQKDLEYLQEKMKRDGALMSDKEKKDVEKQMADKYKEFQEKGTALRQAAGQRQNQEQNKIVALVRQAVDNIAAKEKFDLVLQAQAVVYVSDEANITEEVVKQVSKLNN